MKFLISVLLLVSAANSSLAVDRAELDYRIRKLTLNFEALQANPARRIPPQMLRDAKGIVLLDRTKAGFLFAYEGGSGVVMVRDPQTGQWSPPAFVSANQASIGFQAGGQQSFVVVLLMNTNAVAQVASGVYDFAGEAAGSAGNNSAGTEATLSSTEPLTMVYSDTAGLFGGVALRGDSLTPDTRANVEYYRQFLTTPEILFGHKVQPSLAAQELDRKLDESAGQGSNDKQQ